MGPALVTQASPAAPIPASGAAARATPGSVSSPRSPHCSSSITSPSSNAERSPALAGASPMRSAVPVEVALLRPPGLEASASSPHAALSPTRTPRQGRPRPRAAHACRCGVGRRTSLPVDCMTGGCGARAGSTRCRPGTATPGRRRASPRAAASLVGATESRGERSTGARGSADHAGERVDHRLHELRSPRRRSEPSAP